MKYKNLTPLFLIIALATFGCSNNIKTIQKNDPLPANHSVVFGSLTVKNLHSGWFAIKSASSNKIWHIKKTASDATNKYTTEFAVALPQGDYSINNWLAYVETPFAEGYKSFNSKPQTNSINFTVFANKANYLGSYVLEPIIAKSLLGTALTVGASLTLTNKLEAETKNFHKNLPQFAKLEVASTAKKSAEKPTTVKIK